MTPPASLGPPATSPSILDLAASAEEMLEETEATMKTLQEEIDARREGVRERLQQLVDEARAGNVHLDTPDFEAFLKEPYCIVPTAPGEWAITCPRWVDFHVGMLERSTSSYNVFRVNKYAKWLGNVPAELAKHFAFKDPLPAVVADGFVHVRGAADQDVAWERYGKHLTRREGTTKLRVKEGAEFKLIAEMIEDGILPFTPHAVKKEHLRAAPAWHQGGRFFNERGEAVQRPAQKIELRDYQERAWKEFLEKGAIGVYWPMSAGKTFITLYMHAHVKGPHLVIVPSATLEEQWEERIAKYLAPEAQREVFVLTYAAYDKLQRIMRNLGIKAWRTITFDECHVLPANTFSKFSTVPTEYRMGLSATPYREDGRTDLIFALTGWPVGLDWNELIDLGIIEVPTIHLVITPDEPTKTKRVEDLLRDKKRSVIFCDGIEKGEALARRLGLEFVSGSTSKRLDLIRHELQTRGAVIVSRVGDEGLSLPELERVIEVDFLFGSRRQEGQRLGRLFHADERGEHWILMTRDEHTRYEKRLLAIREKGFRIHREVVA
jgi:DNA excision repair protein ERCC-3